MPMRWFLEKHKKEHRAKFLSQNIFQAFYYAVFIHPSKTVSITQLQVVKNMLIIQYKQNLTPKKKGNKTLNSQEIPDFMAL